MNHSIPPWVQDMPKVELHVHLEGSIEPETVLKLAERNNVELPANTADGLREWYQFQDFPHFVSVYVAVSGCIRNEEDILLVAKEFLKRQAKQNVVHTEATYTVGTIERLAGIPAEAQLAALGEARRFAQKELDISVGWVFDICRGDSVSRADQILDWALAGKSAGVCALGLSGEERLGCTEFKSVFQRAKASHLPITVHTGETMGSESIWEALAVTEPDRIGHGVRSVEDPALMKELRSRQIHLEVCPSSNVCLGVFENLDHHSLAELIASGMNFSINSDDPPMFNASIANELWIAHSKFGLDEEELWELQRNSLKNAFISESERSDLARRLSQK